MANDVLQVVSALKDYINDMEGLPCAVELEMLGEPPSMMLQQLSGAARYWEDIIGNYEARFPFAVYIRIFGTTETDRIDAVTILNDLGTTFDEATQSGTLPDLGDGKTITSITMTNFPSLIARAEDGTEDYQAIYRLEYKQNY